MNFGLMKVFLLVVGCLFQSSKGQHRGPSRVPLSVKPPQPPGGNATTWPEGVPGPFLRDFKPPFPTDSWWQGMTVINRQTNTAAGPFPFQVRTENDGLQFGVATARKLSERNKIEVPEQMDLSISMVNLPLKIDNRKATGWDTQTVSLQYLASDGSTMDTTLVPGSPYLTFKFNKAQVILKGLKGNLNFTWDTTEKKGRVTTVGGVYLLYIIDGTLNQFTVTTTTLKFGTVFTGTLRLAKLVDPAQESILDTYSSTYAKGLTMAYDVQNDVGTTTWTWDVVGDPTKLLIMSWPHHRKVLQQPNYVDIEYMNVKGRMKGVVGNKWVQKFNLPPIRYKSTLPPHNSCLNELKKTLEYEVNALEVKPAGNVYRWASAISTYATLATIADSLGMVDLRNRVVDVMKTSFEGWFDANQINRITYETAWGGVIHSGDKSSVFYNDHHFCYGYHLYASAIVGKFDPAWLSAHLDYFTQLARDYGNPSPDDPYFTVARHADFFTGHSWASGLENGAGERNQESSSEAINAYYGLMLFGDVSGNTELVKWARLLLAIELIGTQTYWHLYPNSQDPENPYPEIGFRKIITVGNIYPAGASRFLHWGSSTKIQIAAIQILPVTPIGDLLYDKEWMKEVVPFCSDELGASNSNADEDVWKSPIYAAYATVNPKLAYNYSGELTKWGAGNSASNQLYFISTQPSADGGDICSNAPLTPEGLFLVQDVDTGNYMGTWDGKFRANLKSSVIATPVQLGFIPGGGTIKSTWNDKFVTGNSGGSGLFPDNGVAAAHQIFRWKQVQTGYELTAMINRKTVKADSTTGVLLNNDASPYGKFRLVPTTIRTQPSVPAEGKLQSVHSNLFVVSTNNSKVLEAKAVQKEDGTTFRFEKVSDKGVYIFWNTLSGLAVTGNTGGTTNLIANKAEAKSWENFRIIFDNGNLVFIHDGSGMAVAVDANGKLFNNATEVGTATSWKIVQ